MNIRLLDITESCKINPSNGVHPYWMSDWQDTREMVELSMYWEKWMEVDIKDCELWLKIVLERCADF